jgi:hypothetical protein
MRFAPITATTIVMLVTACGGRTPAELEVVEVAPDAAEASTITPVIDSGAEAEAGPVTAPDGSVTCTPPVLTGMRVDGALTTTSYQEGCSNGTYAVSNACADGTDVTCTGPTGTFMEFSPDDLCSTDSGGATEAFSLCGFP